MANNVVRATLTASPLAVCGTGNLTHQGSFRVKARVYASAAGQYVRLSWQEGDGPYRSNPYVTPPVPGAFNEIDLGLITVPPKQLGTQRWSGRIEAYTTTTPGTDTLDIDYLVFVPAGEWYGRARGEVVPDTPSVFSVRDEFNQTAGALTGKVAPVGGTYVAMTGSDTNDLQVEATGHTAQRTDVSDTGTILGGIYPGRAVGLDVNLGATAAQMDWKASVDSVAVRGLMIRVVDASNFLAVTVHSDRTVRVRRIVAAGGTLMNQVNAVSVSSFTGWQSLRFAALGASYYVWMGAAGGNLRLICSGSHADLESGGALATGDVYLYDDQATATACTRNYDNFQAWVPPIPTVLYSGRTAEIRSDGAGRQDSTGTYYGPMPAYRGGPIYIPPAGDKNRTTRLFAKAHRNDIEAAASEPVTDSLTVQVIVTPRYAVVPF
jgi:hypothetical protein